MPSPWIIGMIETRTSISRPCTRILMRPSCGRRFSAMFSRAMILMRLMIAAWKRLISGGSGLRLQQAVDAVADAQAVFFGLDVDVAGPLVGGLDQDLVDQLDDRGFLGHLGQLRCRRPRCLRAARRRPSSRSCDQGGDGLAADAEVRLDEPGDFARAGQHRLDVQAGQRLQFVEGVDVERVAGGDDERAVLARRAASGSGGGRASAASAASTAGSILVCDRSTSSMPNSSARTGSRTSSLTKPLSMRT